MFAEKIIKGDARTKLVKKNIAGSLIIKGWNCIVQFMLVPITLDCLTQYEYGVWLTVNSILIWIDQFDIGLGNGLRNRLAEAIAADEKEKARNLVSTTLVSLFCIIFPIVLSVIYILHHVDCYALLNVDRNTVHGFSGLLSVLVALVGGTFVLKVIGNVYLGLQLPAINNLLVVAGQTLALAIIFVLSQLGIHSLYAVAVAYTTSPLLVYLLSYPITFARYKFLSPSISRFRRAEFKGIFSLGLTFFFIQVAGLVIFASSNILITRLLSPADVTIYQISYRYFSLVIMIFTLISAPLWTATTDAYTKGDIDWIRHTEGKMRKVMCAFTLLLLCLYGCSKLFYTLWVGSSVHIGWNLSAYMAIYVAVLMYSTCYSNILFGIGKLYMITIVTVFEAAIYIPLAVWLGGRFGLDGIVCALILVNTLCAVCNKIQCSKLIGGKAVGIWNK